MVVTLMHMGSTPVTTTGFGEGLTGCPWCLLGARGGREGVRFLYQRSKQLPWGQALWYCGIEMAVLENQNTGRCMGFEEEECNGGGVCCMSAWCKCWDLGCSRQRYSPRWPLQEAVRVSCFLIPHIISYMAYQFRNC